MIHKHRKWPPIAAALLITAVVATPAAARQRPDADVCCGRWLCQLLQYIQNRPCPDEPETDVPELPDDSLPGTGTPSEPETPEGPESPETGGGSVSSLERQVVELVNQERAAYGLAPLTLSTQLSDGARLKSQDMRDNGYFDHTSPTYGTPFEMMRSLGITYSAAAENIAMGYSTAEAVVAGWMNSPSHRANILSENYTHIGVGHVDGYWTQWFTR